MNTTEQSTSLIISDKSIELDNNGYLLHFEDWDHKVALKLAQDVNINLSEFHILLLEFLRDHYHTYQVPPSPQQLLKKIDEFLDLWGYSNNTFRQIFPKGGYKQACRLAGLPTHRASAC